MSKYNARIHRVFILAGQTIALKISGRHVLVVSSPLPLTVRIGDMSESEFLSGQGVSLDRPDEFDRVELAHKGALPIWVEIWIGYVAFVDNRRDNVESPTEVVGWGGTQIAATDSVPFPPLLSVASGRIRRKSVIVANLDPAISTLLYITDMAGNIICPVGGGEKVTLPISELFIVANLTGAPVACAVGEVYWKR